MSGLGVAICLGKAGALDRLSLPSFAAPVPDQADPPCAYYPDSDFARKYGGFVYCGGPDAVSNMQWQTTEAAKTPY
jgi:hypothetical protein